MVDIRYERSARDQSEDKEEMLVQIHIMVYLVSYYFILHLVISVVVSQEFHFAVSQGLISDGQNNIIK